MPMILGGDVMENEIPNCELPELPFTLRDEDKETYIDDSFYEYPHAAEDQ